MPTLCREMSWCLAVRVGRGEGARCTKLVQHPKAADVSFERGTMGRGGATNLFRVESQPEGVKCAEAPRAPNLGRDVDERAPPGPPPGGSDGHWKPQDGRLVTRTDRFHGMLKEGSYREATEFEPHAERR